MILVIASVVILSETLRTMLQDAFAVLCQQFADAPLFFSLLLAVLVTCCLVRASLIQTMNTTSVLVIGFAAASYRANEHDIPRPLSFEQAAGVVALVYLLGFVGMWAVKPAPKYTNDKYAEPNPDADVIIIGGGTTGCAMAMGLAKQGKKVLVFEKTLEYQDRFVGELMQPGGLDALRSLDLLDCAETETDIKADGYYILKTKKGSEDHVVLPYPERIPKTFLEYLGYSRAPNGTAKQYGRGFHNGKFVDRLRAKVFAHENVTCIEGTVTKLISDTKTDICRGVQYRRKAPAEDVDMPVEQAKAPLVIVCDGLWSGLRRELSTDQPKQISSFIAILMKHPAMEASVPFRGYGHVILAEPSPIVVYQISPTETRVLVDVPGKVPSQSNGDLTKHLLEVVAPQMPEASHAAFIQAVNEGPVKSMPNREFMTTQPSLGRCIMIGDSWNMRHPLTGGGMSVALRDAVLLSDLLGKVDFVDADAIAQARHTFEETRVNHSSTINILANALYHVFAIPDGYSNVAAREDLRESCYQYLKLGGMFSSGPLGLLCALTPKPFVLATHFFMVAGYAASRVLGPVPTPGRLLHCYRVFHEACMIIMPLLERENVTILAWTPLACLINVIFPFRR
ncbi:squalene monooxygenase-like isoform X1 [Achlya hypogyna]|uniref:squalene monooxygenase n=1 Tax=Achlya hypogyna TaxID=1202772 RepID=A0A1V9ZRK4_ACHHY|nr:squalene monooxygenase-like isoform X1 [Achlya hypogyna]